MKKLIVGVLIGFGLATTIALAKQAGESGMGGMMRGMMGEQKFDQGSSSMHTMMGKMMKMVDKPAKSRAGGNRRIDFTLQPNLSRFLPVSCG